MWLKKKTGGTSIGPYSWPEDGSVAEVDDKTGGELLAIPDGGFEQVGEPERAREISEVVPDGDATDRPRRTAAGRKPGNVEE